MKICYHTIRWGYGKAGETLPQVLDEILNAGFRAIETHDADVSRYLTQRRVFLEMLRSRGIQLAGLFTFYLEHYILSPFAVNRLIASHRFKKLIKFASDVECEKIVLNGFPLFMATDMSRKLKKLSQIVTKIGKTCKEFQVQATFHPSYNSVKVTISQLKELMDGFDPEFVNLTLATGHLSLMGLDPVEVMKTFKDRIDHVHLEDVDGEKFVELGNGRVNIKRIIKTLKSVNYKGWLVIEDAVSSSYTLPPNSLLGTTTKSPSESAKNSIRYVKDLLKLT